jgi:hypothetical protein
MSEPREDMLISRIVDGEASTAEWREFETLAGVNLRLWRNLALAQRDHAALSQAVNQAGERAEAIALPTAAHRAAQGQSHLKLRRASAWSGWAVAALVALYASLDFNRIGPGTALHPGTGIQTAGLPFQSAAEAFHAYLQKGMETGEVVGELESKLLLDTRPATSGEGYEVIYLRQIMERTYVPDLYEWSGEDETGAPVLVRYQPAVSSSL